jgi:hypothetical protein
MNRGTIALVVVGIIVIIGVLVINNNQANTPDATPTASQIAGGPLFLGVTAHTLVRFEVRDNTTGARTVLARSGEDLWELEETGAPGVTNEPPDEATVEATEAASATSEATAEATAEVTPEATPAVEPITGQTIDQETVQTNLTAFLGLNAADRFESDQLADFGLDRPVYSILVTSEDGTEYVVHIGGQNPTGNRYYAVQEQVSGAEATPGAGSITEEATADATHEATPEATEAIDSTSAEATEAASATSEATAEGTPEATTDLEPLATATLAPLPEPLVALQGTRLIQTIPKTQIDQLIAFITTPPYLIPTPVPTLPIPLPESTVEATQATPEATEQATEEATEQATAEATTEATAEPTAES